MQPSNTSTTRNSPHVLIAEDDLTLHFMFRTALSRYGYRLTCVVDGAAAIAEVQADSQRFQCAVLDVMMPKIDGIQAARTIHKLCPQLPIILMTGATLPNMPSDLPVITLLHKPFRIDGLEQLIALHTAKNAGR